MYIRNDIEATTKRRNILKKEGNIADDLELIYPTTHTHHTRGLIAYKQGDREGEGKNRRFYYF